MVILKRKNAPWVNLHTACHIGILATLHFSAKIILQTHGRLNRLGQKHQVIWHYLKVKNSFHDHQERVMLTKWARQLSAECKLPSWLEGALREIVLFELMRSYFHHSFNRKLGIILSAVAKVVMNSERPSDFWSRNNDWIVVGLLELVKEFNMDQMETWLSYEEGRLRRSLEEKLDRSIRRVKVKKEEQDQKERLNISVQARQQEPTPLEFFDPSLSDPDELPAEIEEDDDAEEYYAQAEEFDRMYEEED